MPQMCTRPRNLAHAACQSRRGARLWRLTLTRNASVAHGRARQTENLRMPSRDLRTPSVRSGVRKMRRARFCFPGTVLSRLRGAADPSPPSPLAPAASSAATSPAAVPPDATTPRLPTRRAPAPRSPKASREEGPGPPRRRPSGQRVRGGSAGPRRRPAASQRRRGRTLTTVPQGRGTGGERRKYGARRQAPGAKHQRQ